MTRHQCKRVQLLLLALPAVAILSGCAIPFGGRSTTIDWDAKTRLGTISVSDPKLYRREALIDERRKDVEWIDKLIEDSKTIEFKPEILREIETITAISAALGLKFDPSAAVSYQRANETSELKQQIDTMKLQLQLDQLKRDAEFVRSKFEAQTEPVNSDLGKLSNDSLSSSISSGLSATDQLKGAIDRLTKATYDFNKDVKGTAKASTVISPLDEFRDRLAYREMLKAARNAASLDELHDRHGSALLRLNFQATVIPDANKSSAPGVVQMRVIPPEQGSALENRFYRGWLDYLNRRLNSKVLGGGQPNSELLRGAVTDNFEVVHYLYLPPLGASGTDCYGFVPTEELKGHAGCSSLVFVAPRYANTVLGGRAYMRFTDDVRLMLADDDVTENKNDQTNRQRIVSDGQKLVQECSYVDAPSSIVAGDGSVQTSEANKLQHALRNAKARLAIGDYYIALQRIARDILKAEQIDPRADNVLEEVRDRTARAGLLTETFSKTVMADCTPDKLKSFDRDAPTIYLTPRAREILWGAEARVAIYEIGPREQVQQMSTVARSANSLGLALSIAGSAPSSGVAAEAAAGYSHQAMGRAEALERLPAVVGYSVGDLKTFGWVLGPRATVDPKGKINLEQELKPYDLSVDLSIPGWWPDFTLEILTAWAPDRAQLVKGDIVLKQVLKTNDGKMKPQNILPRRIHVPMSANFADYASFSTLLASEGIEPRREAKVPIDDIFSTQKVSACRPSTIVLRGDFLWRATTVIVGGVKISGGAISILPDMSGIMIDVPALDEKIIGSGPTVQMSVLTPYGPSKMEVTYDKPADGCKKAEAKADPYAPSISEYQPKSFQLPGLVPLSVEGDKLDKVKSVTFGGVPGKIVSQTEKALLLEFPEDKTKVLVPSSAIIVSFFYENAKKETMKIEKTVAIIANVGGK